MAFQFFVLIALTFIFAGFWVFIHKKGGNTSVSSTFNLFVLSMIFWTFSTAMFYVNLPNRLALFWVNTTYITASFIPSTFLLFSFIFPSGTFIISKRKQFLIFSPSILFFFMYFFTDSMMIKEQIILNGQKIIFFGPGQNLWNLYFLGIFIYALIRFYNMYRSTSGILKDRIKYIFFGSLIAFLLACTTNGILPWYFYNFEAIWLGSPLTLIWIILIGYAIFKNTLTEIPTFIKISIIYLIIAITLILIFTFIFLFCQLLLSNLDIYKILLISGIFFIGIASFIYAPLKKITKAYINKVFFSESYLSIAKKNRLLQEEIVQTEKYKTLATVFNRIIIEIKGPLTALKGYSQYLQKNINDKKFLLEFSKILDEEVDKINNLLNRLSAHSQQAALATKYTNITTLVENTINSLNNNLNQQNIEVVKEYDKDQSLNLNIDPNQMSQALINIIANAIDSMPTGGKLFIKTEKEEKMFKIFIKDSGCGIPEESIPLVFNPFYTLKTGYSGLGLSASKEIIEKHEGIISLTSKLYGGSELIISLPFIYF